MSSTLDRIRRLNQLRPARDIPPPDKTHRRAPAHAEPHPDGKEVLTEFGPCIVVTYAFPLQAGRGEFTLGSLLAQAPDSIAHLYPDFNLHNLSGFHDAAFLDTETTGLGTGASVYAFMVGIGVFESIEAPPAPLHEAPDTAPTGPTHFVVRQVFMRHPAEELSLIRECVTQLTGKQLLVTFNGRAFDLPLLRARLRYNQPFLPPSAMDAPLLDNGAPHLDLLLPARRLWRRRLQSCRLSSLEQNVLQHVRTESDVPGYLIPQLYADYVRTGDPGEMQRVFYHNREDIVSMVSLATHLTLAFDRDRNQARRVPLHGEDWLSLAISHERTQAWNEAEHAFRRALNEAGSPTVQAEIFSRLGRLQKRQGRWQEAADTWQLWLTSVPGNNPEPFVELAKYYEWQLQDYEQAEVWTAWALHNLRQEGSTYAWAQTVEELEHRLDRIRRKQRT